MTLLRSAAGAYRHGTKLPDKAQISRAVRKTSHRKIRPSDLSIPALQGRLSIGLDWIGLDWIGLGWIGLDWIGLGLCTWIGLLDWIGLNSPRGFRPT